MRLKFSAQSMVFTHIFTRFVNFMNALPFLYFFLTAGSSSSPSSTEDLEDSSYMLESKYNVGTRSTLRCKLKRKQRPPAVGRYPYALTKPRGDAALESGLAAAEGCVLCAEAFRVS